MADRRVGSQSLSSITIYLEGGGTGKNTKSVLRQGMDGFLDPIKQLAREKSWRWRLVPCGGRDQTFQRFRNAVTGTQPGGLIVLLVDAEAGVHNQTLRAHLQTRDHWDLAFATDEMVHLMVQIMETWIIADQETLAAYYGSGFQNNALPSAANLEGVSKATVDSALAQATNATQKGVYHKIRHAGELLKRIDHRKVRQRCPSCNRLFDTLERWIAAA